MWNDSGVLPVCVLVSTICVSAIVGEDGIHDSRTERPLGGFSGRNCVMVEPGVVVLGDNGGR
jgi:hypothetical protein